MNKLNLLPIPHQCDRYVPYTELALRMSKNFGCPVNDFFELEEGE